MISGGVCCDEAFVDHCEEVLIGTTVQEKIKRTDKPIIPAPGPYCIIPFEHIFCYLRIGMLRDGKS